MDGWLVNVMARIVQTADSLPTDFTPWEHDQIYNGLDCVITRECLDGMLSQLDATTQQTYQFSKALQAPALEMRLRGVAVDHVRKAEVIDEFYEKIEMLQRNLERIVLEGVGMPHFNWRSNADLQNLFYAKLGIPIIRKQGRPTVDRNALEKMEAYTVARPIISHMSAMRELAKKISVLKTEIDPDGRMRTSYNIAGTDTGRFSSSFSEFGTGGNLQNVEESLRSIFIADTGYKFAKCDAKSGESFVVGAIEWNRFDDPRYLEACDSGDPHTAVARICWPSLPWTGNLFKDKNIAEQPYYRHYTYRFMCKKLGHGSNYGGMSVTLAAQTKLPVEVVQAFQPKYFQAFPAHQQWQQGVADQLARTGHLISLTGRKRWFFGRRQDPDTLRAAIAFDPQGSLADIVNTALLNIWHKHYVIISMHDHDALTFMYPEEQEDEIIPLLMQDLIVRIPLAKGRELAIPYDCKTGWNKGDYDASTNPEGLKDYAGTDARKRPKEVSILDRVVRKQYG
jgi:DNA polymerase I-like protein with 3'-5' exonuclease and polymerase domains